MMCAWIPSEGMMVYLHRPIDEESHVFIRYRAGLLQQTSAY